MKEEIPDQLPNAQEAHEALVADVEMEQEKGDREEPLPEVLAEDEAALVQEPV